MPVRLVATDLDGTLLRADGSVSPRTRAALLAVEAQGIDVVFVTGRPLRWAREVFGHVGGHGEAIVSNGALLWDVAADRAVLERGIAADVALEVADRLREVLPGITFGVETVAGWGAEPAYPPHPSDDLSGRAASRRAPLAELVDAPLLKLLGLQRDGDPDLMLAAGHEAVGDLVTVTHSSFPMLEMSAHGVTKAATLAVVAEQRGIAPDEVIAFGDMPNDLPLLGWAGTSYAMANAHASVRAAADHVVASNEEDGVAVVLESLLRA